MFTSRFMPDGNAEQLALFNEHQRLSCDGQRAAAIVRAKAGQDACVLAAKVQAPTLVLHSEGDLAIPLALRHELAARLGLADKTVRNMLSARTPSSAWRAAPWRSSKRGTWACTTGTELGHTGHLSRGHGLAMALK